MQYLNKCVMRKTEELSRRELDIIPHNAFSATRTALYISNNKLDQVLNQALKKGSYHFAFGSLIHCGFKQKK
jgi:hypothetical protein